jgi:DNA polymerase-1
MKKLFVIDFMAMAFRNFHAFGQNPLSTSSGFPTSAIYGSSQFILKLIQDEKPDYLVAACDSPEPTFRHQMYDKYKANRSEMPTNLALQIPVLFRMFEAFDIPVMRLAGVEADDIIGSIALQLGTPDLKIFIVSGDKDFMQLIDDNRVVLYCPKKGGKVDLIDEAGVLLKFGVKPSQVIDILALMGDSSDNVPGVPGIGEKGATQLIVQYGSLDGIYKNLDSIANKRQRDGLNENKHLAALSRDLVTIKTDIPLHFTLDEARCHFEHATANQHLLSLMREMEFKALSSKIESILNQRKGIELPKENRPHDSIEKKHKKIDSSASLESSSSQVTESHLSKTTESNSGKFSTSETDLPNAVFGHRQNATYTVVNSAAEFEKCMNLLNQASHFAFDTETTGLDIHESRPIGFSFSTKVGQGFYIPCIQKHLHADLPADQVIEKIGNLLTNSVATKVAHNLKFDLQMCQNLNIYPRGPFGDTMLQAFLVDASRNGYGIDALSLEYLGIKKIPTTELMGPKKQTAMSDVPLEKLAEYAAEDADCCLRLFELFNPMITHKKLSYIYENIEIPLVEILAKMEREGIFVDADALGLISEALDAIAKENETKIWELAGEKFNINSTKQLAAIIFEKLKIHEQLGIKKIKKTQSGYSTDVTVLEMLSGHPLPEALLEYRTVAKLKNTYVDTLPQLIHPKTSRVHTSFHQTGTATGRLSSSNPNLQNIPIRSSYGRQIRKAFRSRDDNWVLLSADYSQIELRILAHLSKDENLKNAFLSGHDIHKATAAFMFGKTIKDVSSEERSRAKAINYGLIYGMGPNRLARETGVSMAEAKGFIDSYFKGFPKIRDFIEGSVSFAREHGYSQTMTGRRRPIDSLDDPNGASAAYARNMAVNSPIQGSAADLIKIAMIKLDSKLMELKSQTKILLQVHDELVMECPKSEVESILPIVKHAMETAIPMDVPIEVNIGVGTNWLEAH